MVELQLKPLPNMLVKCTGETLKKVMEQLCPLFSLPHKCPHPGCGAPTTLFFKKVKTNKYYGVCCTGDVRHENTFGVYQESDSMFYKSGDEWRSFGSQQGDEP